MRLKAFIFYGAGFLIFAILIAWLIYHSYSNGQSENIFSDQSNVVAVVNGFEINVEQVNKWLNFNSQVGEENDVELRKRFLAALDHLIDRQIFLEEAQKRNIIVTDQEVDGLLNRQYDLFGEEYIQNLLDQKQMSLDDYMEQLRERLIQEKLQENIKDEILAELEITDEEISNYYDDKKDEFNNSEFAHIYIKISRPAGNAEGKAASEKAVLIIERLKSGDDFALLAREFSEDASTKNNGGRLGSIYNSNFSAKFKNVALQLNAGEFTDEPLKVHNAYHIIKCLNSDFVPLSEVKDLINNSIKETKLLSEYAWYVEKLKEKTEVEKFIN